MSSDDIAIRRPGPDDIGAIVELELRNRADLERTGPPRGELAWQPENLRKRVSAMVEEVMAGRRHSWVITVDDVIAGDIGLHHVDLGAGLSAGFGYMVDSAYRGRGVATRAVRLLTEEAFGRLGLHRLEAGARPDNVGSCRALEKAGFRRVGVLERLLWVDGAWRDHVLYELVAPDFVPSFADGPTP